MSALTSPVSVAESFGEFRTNGLVLDGPPYKFEAIRDYYPGKFHPVHLGDLLGERYKVLNKLGNGSYGIVWLCQDVQASTPKYVAVKILKADASIHDCPELRVNRLVEVGIDKGDMAERFGVTMDNFQIQGPNGTHFCLVYPVLGPPVSKIFDLLKVEDPGQILRNLCFQVTQAMATLHSHGICHGDVRPENILARVSGLDGLFEEQVRQAMGDPCVTRVVLPNNLGQNMPHNKAMAPQYLVEPMKWHVDRIDHVHEHPDERGYWDDRVRPSSKFVLPSACIIDFHESFTVSNLPEDLGIPPQYRSPEYIFDKDIGYGTDLWALGCTLFEIRTGRVLFQMHEDDLDDYLVSVVELLGKLPEPWWSTTWEERREYFADTTEKTGKVAKPRHLLSPNDHRTRVAPQYHSIQDAISGGLVCMREYGPSLVQHAIPSDEARLFADLLKRLLRYSPEDRITAEEALEHPWFGM